MESAKGFSKIVLLVLVIIMAVAVVLAVRYCAGPLTTVMTGGIERAEPAIDKAKTAREAVEKKDQATQEALKKMEQNGEP